MSQHARLKIDTGLDVYSATAQPVAARHERKYQWAVAAVFPERHRPERHNTDALEAWRWPSTELANPWLENTCRGI